MSFLILIKEKFQLIKQKEIYIEILVLVDLNKKSLFLKSAFLILTEIFFAKLKEIIIYLII